ncbi:D-alanyl-D-alanine carboxypeptidase family protein [Streptomyces radicis]|uniref:D-alanyl-D-alanine carboxypeptidase n=1 Tax=Streptomyces radicis TaxID=1750517 RepID=A0A3A9WGJ4_9ACTN|nr:serine hydrolase [Streptomyces radicis]RKN05217.1 D-alanyl-D-alanine carboxypeptidase [Streptomyces radicis]RKN16750.1 D-alanyl-D-alanine carboxypeptidase [Streptomyces radicis]
MPVRALVLAIVTPALLAPAVAAAADDDPPAERSAVGGELLASPRPQVRADDGAPALPDDLTAASWIVADAESGDVLAARDAHRPLPPASTLKMLFADALLPKFDRDDTYVADPDDMVDLGPGSSAVGLDDGATYTVEDLWHGVFLASGNDAVAALTAMNGGREPTVAEMNERADDLQANDTHVVSPDGYDAEGQVSSAYDLTLIARSGMQNADFRAYAATPNADFPGEGEGEDRETYEIQNTNRLLVGAPGLEPYEGIAGVKNGYTSGAGYTFTGVAERGGRVLLVTVMDPDGDSLTVYRETAALFDWGFDAADSVEPIGELVPPLSELPQDPPRDPGEATGGADADGANPAEGSGATGQEGAAGGGGDGISATGLTVLGVTAAGLAAVAGAAYLFHRRHPLPLSRPSRPSRPARPSRPSRPWRRRADAPPE